MIQLELTPDGGIAMLHSDDVDLREFGKPQIKRASHVEPCGDGWGVWSAKTGKLLDVFPTRKEALEWESHYYSPTGEGWAELKEVA